MPVSFIECFPEWNDLIGSNLLWKHQKKLDLQGEYTSWPMKEKVFWITGWKNWRTSAKRSFKWSSARRNRFRNGIVSYERRRIKSTREFHRVDFIPCRVEKMSFQLSIGWLKTPHYSSISSYKSNPSSGTWSMPQSSQSGISASFTRSITGK